MISAKKLIKLARKWQKLAALNRKRVALPHIIGAAKAEKGYFAVYSADRKRFLLPLEYLNNELIKKLFDMAEEEFGLKGNGPLTLPFEAEIMECAIGLIKQEVNRDIKRAFLTSISNSWCSLSCHHQLQVATNQLPICSL